MSIGSEIIKLLFEPRFRYKGVPVSFFGIPAFSSYKKSSLYSAVSRLKKENYICADGEYLRLLPKSKEYLKRRQDRLKVFSFEFKKDAPRNLLVMFDIPEEKKAEREWFRFHLKRFNFVMIQRSVWVGPSPLPKEFSDYVKKIGLINPTLKYPHFA